MHYRHLMGITWLILSKTMIPNYIVWEIAPLLCEHHNVVLHIQKT